MKNKKIVIIIMTSIIAFVCINVYIYNSKIFISQSDYSKNTQDFILIEVGELEKIISDGSEVILYTGRETCPWCVEFVEILSIIQQEKNLHIYYLDSEDSDVNESLSEFRQLYSIEYVPSLIYFKNGENKTIEFDITSPLFDKDVLIARLESIIE